MRVVRSSRLELREGPGDEVWELDLCEVGPDRFVVQLRYGPRGALLEEGTGTELPVARDEAERVFDRLEREKLSRGYTRSTGAAPPPAARPAAEDPRDRLLRE